MEDNRKIRTLDKKWGVLNSHTIICHKSKRFENIIVCASSCHQRCNLFKKFFNINLLLEYIENHPEYEIIGELMPQGKTSQKAQKETLVKGKLFWVITDNTFEEVTEHELISNPANYLNKTIFEKPKDQFELIVSLKKKTVKP